MKNKQANVLICVIALLVFSCTPSLKQLQSYEFAKQLSNETLYIPIETRADDIALFKEYGETKKAERLQRQSQKEIENLKTAFRKEYNFSDVAFVPVEELPPHRFTFHYTVEEVNREDRQNYLVTLTVKNDSFQDVRSIRIDRKTNFSSPNLLFLVKQLNSKLHKLNRHAK